MADMLIPLFDNRAFNERLKKAIKSKDAKALRALDAEIVMFANSAHGKLAPHLPPALPPKIREVPPDAAEATKAAAHAQSQEALRLHEKALTVWLKKPKHPPDEQISVLAPFRSDVLADAYARVENTGSHVRFVFLHPFDFADFRKDDRLERLTEWASPAAQQSLGLMGRLWTAWLFVSPRFEPRTVWFGDEAGKNWSMLCVLR